MTMAQCNGMMLFNVVVLITVINLLSFWILPLKGDLLLLPFLSLLVAFLSAGMMVLLCRHLSFVDQGTLVVAAMLANIGTLAGICGYILYGELSFAYIQLFAVPQNILMVVLAFPLAQYYAAREGSTDGAAPLHFSLRELLFTRKQLGVAGMLIGLGLQLFQVERPACVTDFFRLLVHIQAWIAFTPVGYTIDFHRAYRYLRQAAGLFLIRFLLVPLLICGVSSLVVADPVLLGTIFLASSAPVAINAVITAQLFHLNVDLSVAAFLETTVVYVAVIFPIGYWMFCYR
ncbi:MAG: hypothetical protein Q4F92_04940 [Acidaminococcus sp.]|uniref:AEC family transporter n=1 Tax=Acidaminococcus sp. TaxID=1872103 RepID=UPI0026DF78A8|nr:hypothetical protein [Acidaminococcus sp.]MDO5597678.1 hypothetical protein [Acidaminococcus sp.]